MSTQPAGSPPATESPQPQRSRADAGHLLGDFLRAHRARLTPDEVGIPSYGTRRVPGLRREELAQLSGVSTTYYTRLEQGEAMNPSAAVISALARALRLDADATVYLHSVAGTSAYPNSARGTAPPSTVGAGTSIPGASGRSAPGASGVGSLRNGEEHSEECMSLTFDRIVDWLPGTASITLSPTNDVLSCTPLAHALFFSHLPAAARPWNTYRLLFTDSVTRELYRDWGEEASLAVASLRFHAAAHPHDPTVRALIGELSADSREFAQLWAEHPVRRCTRGYKLLHHPDLGDLDLEYQILHAPDGDGRRILIHTAAAGSPTAAALVRLVS